MLAYIGEIDRRQLYLADAYPSMFAYCTTRFRMSEAIAAKRIRAGRAACRFPCILDMIRRGELHLSGIHRLAGHLTDKNHKQLLKRAKHRSMREIDELIAEVAPRPDGRSIVRTIAPAHGADEQRSTEGVASGTGTNIDNTEEASTPGMRASTPASSVKNLTMPLSPRRYRLHVTIGQQARSDLEELKNLLSHQIPDGDPAQVVERALALFLEDTKKKKAALTDKPRTVRKGGGKKTRAIPAAVRRKVYKRDGGRCAFVDVQGRRCSSKWQVEFHHRVPYAREGPHTTENIELRCRAHNQYEAEREYGRAFMRSRRESAQSRDPGAFQRPSA